MITFGLPNVVKTGECQFDRECPENRACIDNHCQDPCQVPFGPCGQNAECQVSSHTAVCRCPAGWAGNPQTSCYQCKTPTRL